MDDCLRTSEAVCQECSWTCVWDCSEVCLLCKCLHFLNLRYKSVTLIRKSMLNNLNNVYVVGNILENVAPYKLECESPLRGKNKDMAILSMNAIGKADLDDCLIKTFDFHS